MKPFETQTFYGSIQTFYGSIQTFYGSSTENKFYLIDIINRILIDNICIKEPFFLAKTAFLYNNGNL